MSGQRIKVSIILFMLFISVNVFAANPSQPFLPSDNVQDPNCVPTDSNCYVITNGISSGGNSFGNTLTIGTNDNQALEFETNNVTALTITPEGNIGIGTTTPNSTITGRRILHISDVVNNAELRITGSAADARFFSTNVASGFGYTANCAPDNPLPT